MSLATLRKNVCTNIDIGTALKEIAANPHIGDELAFDLLDGRHIECAVTDINDNAIRFDSVDCLGDDMIYGKVEKWLDRIDHLLPDELQRAIIDTERKHVINGKKMDRLERLFLPAASELFSGDNVLGDKGLYKQIDWYKDRRHRMRILNASNTASRQKKTVCISARRTVRFLPSPTQTASTTPSKTSGGSDGSPAIWTIPTSSTNRKNC